MTCACAINKILYRNANYLLIWSHIYTFNFFLCAFKLVKRQEKFSDNVGIITETSYLFVIPSPDETLDTPVKIPNISKAPNSTATKTRRSKVEDGGMKPKTYDIMEGLNKLFLMPR